MGNPIYPNETSSGIGIPAEMALAERDLLGALTIRYKLVHSPATGCGLVSPTLTAAESADLRAIRLHSVTITSLQIRHLAGIDLAHPANNRRQSLSLATPDHEPEFGERVE